MPSGLRNLSQGHPQIRGQFQGSMGQYPGPRGQPPGRGQSVEPIGQYQRRLLPDHVPKPRGQPSNQVRFQNLGQRSQSDRNRPVSLHPGAASLAIQKSESIPPNRTQKQVDVILKKSKQILQATLLQSRDNPSKRQRFNSPGTNQSETWIPVSNALLNELPKILNYYYMCYKIHVSGGEL